MTGWTPDDIGGASLQAILYEVAATPKPGLVDRRNAGAHRDMDFYTFLTSAAALAPFFTEMAALGQSLTGLPPAELFRAARPLGMRAERRMLDATGGINTHKGAVFSLGLACLAAGRLSAQGEALSPDAVGCCAAEMTAGLCEREYGAAEIGARPIGALTKGERIYLEYGLGGVREEAERGFPHVREVAYPVLSRCLDGGVPLNDSLLHTLLYLMAEVDDTNVLGRCGTESARYAREQARRLLEDGGALHPAGRERLERLDDDFIARDISPGGCADLLALTLLLYRLARPGETLHHNRGASECAE